MFRDLGASPPLTQHVSTPKMGVASASKPRCLQRQPFEMFHALEMLPEPEIQNQLVKINILTAREKTSATPPGGQTQAVVGIGLYYMYGI